MVLVDVNSDDGVVEVGVGALENFVVLVLFVAHGVEAAEDELEHCF